MVTVRAMRNFRLRHRLSLREVAEAAGRSAQWISMAELGRVGLSLNSKRKLLQAFQKVISGKQSRLMAMEQELQSAGMALFEEEPEWTGS